MTLGAWLDTLTTKLWRRFGQNPGRVAAGDAGYDRTSAALEARLILSRVLELSPSAVLARAEMEVSSRQSRQIASLLRARLGGYPTAYLVGEVEFFSLRFHVNPYVLIPRPETELLVEQTLSLMPDQRGLRVLEPGTGSGCVAISLARARPGWSVEATDRHRSILDLARANAGRVGVRNIRWTLASWLDGLDDDYDVIVSNPPYVGADVKTLNSLCFEPLEALYGGEDGLEVIAGLLRNAPRRLRPGGWLLLEIGADQAGAAERLAHRHRYGSVEICRDLSGRPRLLRARYGRAVDSGPDPKGALARQ